MNQTRCIYDKLNLLPKWYALHTKYRHEKKVDIRLKEKGITSYLPLNTIYRRWSDRYKKVMEPLFSCYVFVFIDLNNHLQVLQTEGAIQLVSFNGIPASIPEEQIDAIKQILEQEKWINCVDFFSPGKKVRIVQGPLKGLEGILNTKKNDSKLIIIIEAIRQAISVEIDYRDLELV